MKCNGMLRYHFRRKVNVMSQSLDGLPALPLTIEYIPTMISDPNFKVGIIHIGEGVSIPEVWDWHKWGLNYDGASHIFNYHRGRQWAICRLGKQVLTGEEYLTELEALIEERVII